VKSHLIQSVKGVNSGEVYSNEKSFKEKGDIPLKIINGPIEHRNQGSKLKLLLFTLLKYFVTIFHLPFLFKKHPDQHFLIYPTTNKDRMLNLKGVEVFEVNHLYYLIEKSAPKFIQVQENFIPNAKYSFRAAVKRLSFIPGKNKFNIEAIYISEILRSPSILKRVYNDYKSLKFKMGGLVMTTEEDKFIHNKLNAYLSSNLVFIARFHIFKAYFERKRFQSIVTIDENAALKKSILDAAKLNGIKTVGVQHGAIHRNLPTYFFNEKYTPGKYIPDLTLVWGENYKSEMISNSIFTDESIEVVGQLRTDVVESLKKIRVEKKGWKTVVFATQPILDLHLRKVLIEDTFRACFNKPNINLIIRPHPNEKHSYFEKILGQMDNVPQDFSLNIEDNSDLYLLINSADYLMTYYSTVGLEAMYFEKPLIVIDYPQEDTVNYVRTGGAYHAVNYASLNDCFQRINDGKDFISTSSYQKMIQGNAHRVDGQVCDRILDALQAL
jgi:hypothetical protein